MQQPSTPMQTAPQMIPNSPGTSGYAMFNSGQPVQLNEPLQRSFLSAISEVQNCVENTASNVQTSYIIRKQSITTSDGSINKNAIVPFMDNSLMMEILPGLPNALHAHMHLQLCVASDGFPTNPVVPNMPDYTKFNDAVNHGKFTTRKSKEGDWDFVPTNYENDANPGFSLFIHGHHSVYIRKDGDVAGKETPEIIKGGRKCCKSDMSLCFITEATKEYYEKELNDTTDHVKWYNLVNMVTKMFSLSTLRKIANREDVHTNRIVSITHTSGTFISPFTPLDEATIMNDWLGVTEIKLSAFVHMEILTKKETGESGVPKLLISQYSIGEVHNIKPIYIIDRREGKPLKCISFRDLAEESTPDGKHKYGDDKTLCFDGGVYWQAEYITAKRPPKPQTQQTQQNAYGSIPANPAYGMQPQQQYSGYGQQPGMMGQQGMMGQPMQQGMMGQMPMQQSMMGHQGMMGQMPMQQGMMMQQPQQQQTQDEPKTSSGKKNVSFKRFLPRRIYVKRQTLPVNLSSTEMVELNPDIVASQISALNIMDI